MGLRGRGTEPRKGRSERPGERQGAGSAARFRQRDRGEGSGAVPARAGPGSRGTAQGGVSRAGDRQGPGTGKGRGPAEGPCQGAAGPPVPEARAGAGGGAAPGSAVSRWGGAGRVPRGGRAGAGRLRGRALRGVRRPRGLRAPVPRTRAGEKLQTAVPRRSVPHMARGRRLDPRPGPPLPGAVRGPGGQTAPSLCRRRAL